MPRSEKVGMSDTLGIVLTKANGTVIINEPVKITEALLKKILEESKNEKEN